MTPNRWPRPNKPVEPMAADACFCPNRMLRAATAHFFRWATMRALLIVGSLYLVGCAHEPKSRGVSEQQATRIAGQYFREHSSLSVNLVGPFDTARAWMFTTAGDADIPVGVEIPPVLVDKATGQVTWDAKPPVKK